MNACVIAFDPGSVSGAYGVINLDGGAEVGDLPVVNGQLDAAALARLIRGLAPRVAVVERVGAMPKQGVVSTFKFGYAAGLIYGVLAALEVPVHFVAPTKWKRHFGLMGVNGGKQRSRALAIQLHPSVSNLTRVKDHGRAEALLMADYYLATEGKRS